MAEVRNAASATPVQARLLELPMAGLYPMDVDEANRWLVKWEHKLGPCNRPFRQEAYAFEVDGEPIGVTSGPFAVKTREGWAVCTDGWLALDGYGFPYPIDAREFEVTYEVAP